MEESNGSSTAIGTVVATAQNVVTAVVTKRTVTIASDSDLVREADRVLVAATDAMARATLLPELACYYPEYYNRFRNAQGVAPTLCLKPVRIVKIGFNISRVALSDATDATRSNSTCINRTSISRERRRFNVERAFAGRCTSTYACKKFVENGACGEAADAVLAQCKCRRTLTTKFGEVCVERCCARRRRKAGKAGPILWTGFIGSIRGALVRPIDYS